MPRKATRAATRMALASKIQNDQVVVIDELAGQWIVLLVVPLDWRWWLAAFVSFRLFDIVKPGPVRMAERLPGGLGVMADDVVAGVLAAAPLLVVQIMMTGATG